MCDSCPIREKGPIPVESMDPFDIRCSFLKDQMMRRIIPLVILMVPLSSITPWKVTVKGKPSPGTLRVQGVGVEPVN